MKYIVPIDRKDTCAYCRGWGKISKNGSKCNNCNGTGEFYWDDESIVMNMIANDNDMELCINHDDCRDDVWCHNPTYFGASNIYKECLEYDIVSSVLEFYYILRNIGCDPHSDELETVIKEFENMSCEERELPRNKTIPNDVEYEVYEMECHDGELHERDEYDR